MDYVVNKLMTNLPTGMDLTAIFRLLLIVVAGSLVLGVLGRVIFGKGSGLNHSVCSAIGILFVYAITIAIYTFEPANLSRFLAPLPFVSFHGEELHLFSFSGSEYSAICTQLLNMMILAFLSNLIDSWIPKGKNLIGWYFCRFLTVVLAMLAQLIVTGLLSAYLPGVLVTYAPIILVGILLLLALLSVLNVFLSLMLAIVNPILGGIYAFFFSSKGGKMVGRAIVTTLILSGLVYLLEQLGYGVICIAAGALSAYVPLIIVLLVMWYVLGHVL